MTGIPVVMTISIRKLISPGTLWCDVIILQNTEGLMMGTLWTQEMNFL